MVPPVRRTRPHPIPRGGDMRTEETGDSSRRARVRARTHTEIDRAAETGGVLAAQTQILPTAGS